MHHTHLGDLKLTHFFMKTAINVNIKQSILLEEL